MDDPVKIAVAVAATGRRWPCPPTRIGRVRAGRGVVPAAERAQELAEEARLALGTSDFDELLAVPGLEAVHVATPVVTHVPFAVAAAERGLHVLCEKPLADDLAGARRIAEPPSGRPAWWVPSGMSCGSRRPAST